MVDNNCQKRFLSQWEKAVDTDQLILGNGMQSVPAEKINWIKQQNISFKCLIGLAD